MNISGIMFNSFDILNVSLICNPLFVLFRFIMYPDPSAPPPSGFSSLVKNPTADIIPNHSALTGLAVDLLCVPPPIPPPPSSLF